jgi:hypothetical protein
MTELPEAVRALLDGPNYAHDAWAIIDRISRKYTGQPYPIRSGRVVFLIDHEHAQAHTFG